MPVLDYAPPDRRMPPSAAVVRGTRHLRQSVGVASAATCLWSAGLLAIDVSRGLPPNQWRSVYGLEAIAFVGLQALWLAAYWIVPATFRLTFDLLWSVAGFNVSRDDWNDAAFAALWRLPRATAGGAVLILAYESSGSIQQAFGLAWRVPDDTIAGLLGNALGAWCYVPIVWRWGKLVFADAAE